MGRRAGRECRSRTQGVANMQRVLGAGGDPRRGHWTFGRSPATSGRGAPRADEDEPNSRRGPERAYRHRRTRSHKSLNFGSCGGTQLVLRA